ncbi:FecR domain-containing protein [Wolinella succinogenes]|uniref:FecR protein domain-containing protein n=1 Tax=Wolinella succinogenes (strain ATCC 29543 / DSM 1740 / CCUG 13145 / JCM 31913 / LMG 7466 / NCTC 11488 / FDC 602W) TaxID=273121 RepID=Q7MQV9_WOLSU|nr:FecR domain-containing protein [Wolinella succinogenes]CAE10971.1 hypothetical protein WS1968 [Wolinella succinogenes]VEG81133.1 FecR protein [Wolinella succinogenes]HCZ19027.1 hypothetical protein [Helicobacter sp.]
MEGQRVIARIIMACLFLFSALGAEIGNITLLVGSAEIERGAERLQASTGTVLEEKDTIRTAASSKVQLTFKDKTVITLGPDSLFLIQEYLSDSSSPKAKFSITQGAFKAITGQIGKVAPQNFNLETKTATIGIRGTILGGEIGSTPNGEPLDTLYCFDGSIVVASLHPTAGISSSVVVLNPGEMTRLAFASPPSPPAPISPQQMNQFNSSLGGGLGASRGLETGGGMGGLSPSPLSSLGLLGGAGSGFEGVGSQAGLMQSMALQSMQGDRMAQLADLINPPEPNLTFSYLTKTSVNGVAADIEQVEASLTSGASVADRIDVTYSHDDGNGGKITETLSSDDLASSPDWQESYVNDDVLRYFMLYRAHTDSLVAGGTPLSTSQVASLSGVAQFFNPEDSCYYGGDCSDMVGLSSNLAINYDNKELLEVTMDEWGGITLLVGKIGANGSIASSTKRVGQSLSWVVNTDFFFPEESTSVSGRLYGEENNYILGALSQMNSMGGVSVESYAARAYQNPYLNVPTTGKLELQGYGVSFYNPGSGLRWGISDEVTISLARSSGGSTAGTNIDLMGGRSSELSSVNFSSATHRAYITDEYFAILDTTSGSEKWIVAIPSNAELTGYDSWGDYVSWGYWGAYDAGDVTKPSVNYWVAGKDKDLAASYIDSLIASVDMNSYTYKGIILGQVTNGWGEVSPILNGTVTLRFDFGGGANSLLDSSKIAFSAGGNSWMLNPSSDAPVSNGTFFSSLDGTVGGNSIDSGSMKGSFFGSNAEAVAGAFSAKGTVSGYEHEAVGVFKALYQQP